MVDLHCGNNFLGTQYGMVSPALQFMHLLAYVDSLWFGEGYDYDEEADYWLVEVSGLPFGLMGDMMREGNPWRGMLYGTGPRFRGADPSPIWHLWDLFGIANSTMEGYWTDNPPVRVLEPCSVDVKATSYVRHGDAALIAVAGWNPYGRACKLSIDWVRLGISPTRATLRAPDMGSHLGQAEADLPLTPPEYTPSLYVKIGGGALLLLHQLEQESKGDMVEAEGQSKAAGKTGGDNPADTVAAAPASMATKAGPLGVAGEHLHAAEARERACRIRGGVHCQDSHTGH